MKSFPRRRSWLIPAIIAAVLFIGGVASNLVASDIQEAVKPYRRWVWVTFGVAFVVAIIAAIRDSRSPNDIEPTSTSANARRSVAAGDVTNAAIVTGNENLGLHHSQVQGPVQMVGRQEIHHHYHSGPEAVSPPHQSPAQSSSQKAKEIGKRVAMPAPQSSGADSSAQQHLYDVFLSHQSGDKPQVEVLAARLEDEEGLKPFLDKWHLIPGEPWQEALEEALDQSKTCAVFLGPGGLGPWENEEMRVALDERVRNKLFRVIPVLLPGAEPKDKKILPRFLRRLTWVDLRAGIDDSEAFRRLVSGIRGLAPGRQPFPASVEIIRAESPQIFNLPFPQNKFFTGRGDILERLHTNFNNGERVQALNGMGGIGKTQTAQEYAYRYRENYRVVLWGNGNSRETLVTDFTAMAGLLNLPEKNAQDLSEAVAAVKRWFANNSAWLLIFDNADELGTVEGFIPSGENGHILVTTREHAMGEIGESCVRDHWQRHRCLGAAMPRPTILRLKRNAGPNPSLHPKCYSGLRPLSHSGELKRSAAYKLR